MEKYIFNVVPNQKILFFTKPELVPTSLVFFKAYFYLNQFLFLVVNLEIYT